MQRKPQAKSQASILTRELAALGIRLKRQTALELVAKLNGFKSWHQMSGSSGAAIAAVTEPAVTSVQLGDNPLLRFDPKRQVAILWSIEDVQAVRPDLTDDEAMEVLQVARRKHDAEEGITWATLGAHADWTFAPRLVQVTVTFEAGGRPMRIPARVNLATGDITSLNGEGLDFTDGATVRFPGIDEEFEVHRQLPGESDTELLELTARLAAAGKLPAAVRL